MKSRSMEATETIVSVQIINSGYLKQLELSLIDAKIF